MTNYLLLYSSTKNTNFYLFSFFWLKKKKKSVDGTLPSAKTSAITWIFFWGWRWEVGTQSPVTYSKLIPFGADDKGVTVGCCGVGVLADGDKVSHWKPNSNTSALLGTACMVNKILWRSMAIKTTFSHITVCHYDHGNISLSTLFLIFKFHQKKQKPNNWNKGSMITWDS